ncbi:hypothetical protein BUALT_Bualt13G0022700 [Buddleja alternifolia]|uniref:NAC domain-containing protein n=1 Tax=Buddleja alternifolia TaxID=168488 RepID=A0AAV6WUY2_9LAMI|nr:hypothetical protein BUALT_Bualt13G0022700 [Buddleja alternifolia]
MGLRDIGETLPPGFRFYPSDEELICHYLYKKIANEQVLRGTLVEIDLHSCEPWQLPEVAKLNSDEWYFFSFRDRKYATGYRANRATTSGYWKATGKDRVVLDPQTRTVVGMRKTLVFYKNRAPNGIKTGWIMHEFRMENPHIPPKEDWVLCRVFNKSRCENSNEFIPNNNLYDSTAVANNTSPNLAPSPTNEHALPSNYTIYQNITSLSHTPSHQHENPNTSLGLSDVVGPGSGYLRLSHDHMNESYNPIKLVETKCDDYGFLFDMSFDGVASTLDQDMRFDDDDYDDDGGLIFI